MSTVSVIVPVYNSERYLEQCLASIVGQTHRDLEIIVVNDCSPDRSDDIVRRFAAQDERIHYVALSHNLGPATARNVGLARATGDWVAFVDADDWIDAACLGNMVRLVTGEQADCGIFGVVCFDDASGRTYRSEYFTVRLRKARIGGATISHVPATAWNKIYRRQDIVDLRFPEQTAHEDEEFWYKYVVKTRPMVVGDPTPYYHYRQQSGSIMANRQNTFGDLPRILANIHAFLHEQEAWPEYRQAFLEGFRRVIADHGILPAANRARFRREMRALHQQLALGNDDSHPLDYALYLEPEEVVASYLAFAERLHTSRWYAFGRRLEAEGVAGMLARWYPRRLTARCLAWLRAHR